MERTEAYRQGRALFERLHGEHSGAQIVEALGDVCPDFVDQTFEWAFGGIMARPGLDLLTRQYVLVASCTTLGHATPQLRAHIEAALEIGGTKEQIVEVILQTTFYAGGAAVSNALRLAGEVFRTKKPGT